VSENLFDRFDLDPSAPPQALTERMRELVDQADPGQQEAIRNAWEQLTLHPRRRILEALSTHPETRPPLGLPPLPPRSGAVGPGEEADRVAHAPVAAALGPPPPLPPALPALEADPLLAEVNPPRRLSRPNGGHS
jgi:hypothetical protein